ncbi:DUF1365 domain-containing protein [Limibaculum sp. M0105]|uniref:DUF1365 domain-containing protein n=1 Tax=Thermohalobaculum xanthum TaxID=2753746 RepID=A0A8J7MBE0_9RHOB|nr:DUF1365 domain-containing protein [Thermohalobaculum xanthum]MBK0401049.1 DUF1365 domain-containing protein [Thermohalobaculum xanthum]
MAELSPAIIAARVTHARTMPVKNAFAYGMDYVMLSEDQLSGGRTPRLFSFGRRNLVTLRPSDHGFAAEGGAAWVRGIAADAGLGEVATVSLLTHPRYWGYAFNPVSFWFMQDAGGALVAVLSEVHNTFGDRHCYLCRAADGGPIRPDQWVEAEKRFHVSPFFGIEGRYRFRFVLGAERIGVWISYDDGRGGGLTTALTGTRRPFTDAELLRALARRPLGAAKATALIHWQALKLFLKGVRYRARPEPSEERVT